MHVAVATRFANHAIPQTAAMWWPIVTHDDQQGKAILKKKVLLRVRYILVVGTYCTAHSLFPEHVTPCIYSFQLNRFPAPGCSGCQD